ncbi:uncharacterized protein LOC108052495 isoform X3 [Drosophila rhopaloa]|uniref:Uncharacterized protein n=1 Tax=Drosophila rhopaloa TaxID=1041015 RepID=A0ABM5J3Z7_DRORH|nr:uncharacterized protein LOC108052495 isoform X3 [Drosophila rhopaloa]
MSRNRAAMVSAFKLFLRPSTTHRSLALRLAPVTTFALHLRPGHELQQHRSFASTAEDDETSGGKKSDKHKKPTTGGHSSSQHVNEQAEAYRRAKENKSKTNPYVFKNKKSALTSKEFSPPGEDSNSSKEQELAETDVSKEKPTPKSDYSSNLTARIQKFKSLREKSQAKSKKNLEQDLSVVNKTKKLAKRTQKVKHRRKIKDNLLIRAHDKEIAHSKRELCKFVFN